MRIYYYNNEPVTLGVEPINGKQYPWNWFDLSTDENILSEGFTFQEVPDLKVKSVLAQDILAEFTSEDAGKIKAAVTGNNSFWLLWSAFQAQKDPMHVDNERFLQGWTVLKTVVGSDRMDEIAVKLNLDM